MRMDYNWLRVGMAGLAIALSLTVTTAAFAAPFEFSVTAKAAFDRMIEASPASVAAGLKKQHAELQTLQQQDLGWDAEIASLRYQNEENEGKLQKRIREIDAAKITSLAEASAALKKQYEPLFELYDTQKTQLSLAKSFKNKELTAIMNMQVEATKAAVQAAKKKLAAKEAEIKQAKSAATAKMKQIRDMLGANDATVAKIKAAKSAAGTYKKLFATEAKVLGSAVRGGDATATAGSFTRMIDYQRQILIQKVNIHAYEGRIADTIAKAEAKMLSY
ncbi:hypothetical protein RB620_28295 [Paenibacillus sp. LHD-117]|uniref:hypothetical protein n=1 Tax=Paenibacillus sp. LHD-117 TaxID=3071412 RepID=UPI0027E1D13F|nr:hypothetical protein [Paenibacillus sp. LHD-117]MDQ6423336.1 hypothetical protein [Paenibacillus sp. LHD-117]